MKLKKDHPLYYTWGNMKLRCYNPNAPKYHRYGGRGITICDRWLNDFWAFAEDVGGKPTPKHTLDRIDNDGNYEPGNVRWATRKEQQRNTHWVMKVEIDGITYLAMDLAKIAGLSAKAIKQRASRGLSYEEVVSPERIWAPIQQHVVEKAWAKRRAQTHCKRGHEFTPENTYIASKGERCCRTCMNIKSQAWRDKIRAQGFDPTKPAALRHAAQAQYPVVQRDDPIDDGS
jgi:hypothetical protein